MADRRGERGNISWTGGVFLIYYLRLIRLVYYVGNNRIFGDRTGSYHDSPEIAGGFGDDGQEQGWGY